MGWGGCKKVLLCELLGKAAEKAAIAASLDEERRKKERDESMLLAAERFLGVGTQRMQANGWCWYEAICYGLGKKGTSQDTRA